ncbi:DUF6153 family protein [Streptomyces sp. DSM 40750]|uniref:DUF6153 family protein n=1 Tax=Streptomyces sp. DSM 40750 TaxID=2801030 RepID=UPI00214B7C28|nr:DUF6153 family protein [Streptomyces sp. DSM 40750]UUU19474.1 DUF6153 family protein [Streptomyces sp. DSM 40750]UUU27182.1 DUF6153 family protein [Streptomyces sp. DSM 40750]
MSGRPFSRTAMPCARSRSARLVLVVSLALTTFLLFCAGSPPGDGPRQRPHSVSAPVEERSVAVRADHVERAPCEHGPGRHGCHSPDPRAVLGQVPLPGADHTAATWQPATAPAPVALDGAREPGRARPPDLHELQLLRV